MFPGSVRSPSAALSIVALLATAACSGDPGAGTSSTTDTSSTTTETSSSGDTTSTTSTTTSGGGGGASSSSSSSSSSSGSGASGGGGASSSSSSSGSGAGGSGGEGGALGSGGSGGEGGAAGAGGSGGEGGEGQGGSGGCLWSEECDDGVFCNGAETCEAGACMPGDPPACDDGVACTDDQCDPSADACKHGVTHALCDDGVLCNGVELCDPLGGCFAGLPVVCDDGVLCTVDTCSEVDQACLHTPSQALCDDGVFCNGAELCDPLGPIPTGCSPSVAPSCGSDGIACTLDVCDELTKSCHHTPDSAACPPGQLCVPAQLGCVLPPPCATSADCDDGYACNGQETCAAGVCHSSAPVDCSDGIDCTFDLCLEPSGACDHTSLDALCNDGKACNGEETCGPSGCVAGVPIVCGDDGVACTTEICDLDADACVPVPHHELCGCGETCDPLAGCGSTCQVTTCQGKVYACGDCVDNDGDCRIDAADEHCLGPCDNTESSFYGGISGQNNSPCKSDCYFDQDTGAGNDACYWSHKCDPLEIAPDYYPEGSACSYDPSSTIPGFGGDCAAAQSQQSAQCLGYCGPLTPNGCDCFGCCVIPGAPTPVWLGSESPAGQGSCTLDVLADPSKCHPCTQVSACLNPCDTCEICVGKPTLPPGCGVQSCAGIGLPCGQLGQNDCTPGFFCITGCCQPNPT
jgi:hypothetical protein